MSRSKTVIKSLLKCDRCEQVDQAVSVAQEAVLAMVETCDEVEFERLVPRLESLLTREASCGQQ
jgi:hypothetical protein